MRRLVPLLPWLALLGLAWILMGPAARDPFHQAAGSDWLDSHGTWWFFWWTDHAAREGLDPGFTSLLFHPWGKDLFAHTGGNLLDARLALPLRRGLGPVAGMNAWILLILLGNAFAAHEVARALGAGRAGRWAAAVVGLLHPFALQEIELGRPTQALLLFPGLWVASLLGPLTPKRGLLSGLWLALSAFTYWYYGLVGALLGVAILGLRIVLGPQRPAALLHALLGAGVAAALVLPAAWPMLHSLDAGAVPGLLALGDPGGPFGRLQLQTVEGDTQGLWVLGAAGRAGSLLGPSPDGFHAGARVVAGVHLLLALAVVLPGRRLRVGLPLLVGAVLVLVVAVGPALIGPAGGVWIGDPLWQAVVEHSGVLRRWWWPGRAVAFLPFFSAAGVALLLGWLEEGRRPVVAGLIALVLGVELGLGGLRPLSSWETEPGPVIRCLAEAPEGAVIELPLTLGQRPLYNQTIHGHPMMNGMLVSKAAFVPVELRELLDQNAFLGWVVDLGDRDLSRATLAEEPEGRAALLALGYRYLLFRLDGFTRPTPGREASTSSDFPRVERIARPWLGEPALRDELEVLYTLDGGGVGCAETP